jgi:acetyl esterase/lipase
MMRGHLIALAFLQVAPSIVSAADSVKTADIPYATVKGVEPKFLSLDVHAPKGAKNLPVVVYVHGGYWKAGDKGQVGRLPEFFGNAGYLLVSVNYRLSPAAKHPDHIQNVAKAVAWVHDNIAGHGGDPEQIYLTGHSAGAQLVALLGTDAQRLEDAGKSLKVLRAVVPFDSAAMDLREIAKNDRRADSPYRAAFGDKPEDWADASPVVHAAKGKGIPPFQVVVAYGPALANKKKGVDEFAAALCKAGTRAEVLDASSFREHQSLMTEFGAPDDPVAKAVLAFLESVRTNKTVKGLGGETILKLDGTAGADAAKKLEAYRVRAVMSQYDKNGDGKISKDEMKDQPFLFGQLDADKDGFVTAEEIAAYFRRTAGMEGDGAGSTNSRVKPLEISEKDSPIQPLDAKASDGRAVRAFWRKPKGDGPFPAVVFIHGGLTQFPEEELRKQLKTNPVLTRLLDSGFAVVQSTFRTYERDVQSRGPIEDVRAVVEALEKSAAIDGKRIALFGGSGGGSIALELGGHQAVRAVIAGEPATVLYTGMLTTGEYGPRLKIMADPEKHLTPELRKKTLEKLKTLRAPVLILHGDQHDLNKLNAPLFVPMMKEAGVRVEYREYPGYGHGFYFGGGDDKWGKGADEKVVAEVLRDVRVFLQKEMPDITLKPLSPTPNRDEPKK